MKHVLGAAAWAALLAAASHCGSDNECEEAVAKLIDDCDFGAGASIYCPAAGGGKAVPECEAPLDCCAKCVLDKDCDDITSDKLPNSYTDCVGNCKK